MPRARKRPTLKPKLSPEAGQRLAARVTEIHQRGQAARETLAAKGHGAAGRGSVARQSKKAAKGDGLERRIAKAEATAVALANLGNREDAARAERTAAELKQKLAKRQRAEAASKAREAARAVRLDRFAGLVRRSEILTDWHYAVADAWLEALGEAVDGEYARASGGSVAEAVEAGGAPSGPAIYVSGAKAIDRWKTAVPVAAVKAGRRRLPPVFEPRRVKAPRSGAGDGGPPPSLQEACIKRRGKAERLMETFEAGMAGAGHPAWCAPVAVRVILLNQTLTQALVGLGVAYGKKNREVAQSSMAAGLLAISGVLRVALPVADG